MSCRVRRYVLAHLFALALFLLFFGYALLMRHAFPNGYFHCVLHDFLHLYCPFCGGTRAILAVFRLDFVAAVRLNPALPPAALLAVALDIRALILLCRRSKKPLCPRWCLPVGAAYFTIFFVARDAALWFGFDPAGDLLSFWQGFPAFRAVMSTVTLSMAGTAFLFALFGPQRRTAAVETCLLLLSSALWLWLPY